MPNPITIRRAAWQISFADYLKMLKQRIMYLVVLNKDLIFDDAITTAPTEQFQKTVTQHVNAYINKGVAPPEPISAAIYNIADDILSGRNVSVRAGDYISIQNFLRKK